MGAFLDKVGINNDDLDFVKNVKDHYFEYDFDVIKYIISKMGLLDKLNDEIRKAPSNYDNDEKRDYITRKALELLGSKIPQDIRENILCELNSKGARLEKYAPDKDDYINYFSLQAMLFNRFDGGNIFNRVFDTNVKNMYNSSKKVVDSWLMCVLKDRWKQDVKESPYKKEIDSFTFSAESIDKLDELIDYYDRVKINCDDVVARIFLKKINSSDYDLYTTNTKFYNCVSSVKDGVVYFNDRTVKTNDHYSVFFHELSHYIDDLNDNPSFKAFNNLLEIIRNNPGLDKLKDAVSKAARVDGRYSDTGEVAAMYDAIYKGRLTTYEGFPGHGVEYFSKPGNPEKEILANIGELVTSAREGLLFEFFLKEDAEELISTYYRVIFNTEKEFINFDNEIFSSIDNKTIVDNINKKINNIEFKENGPINTDDYLILYLLQPKIIGTYFKSMKALDNDFVSNMKNYLSNDDYEIDNPSTKKYLDLIGKKRAKYVLDSYLNVKDLGHVKK